MSFKVGLFASSAATAGILLASALVSSAASAAPGCPVTYQQLKTALTAADTADSTGFNNHYWAVVVNKTGVVCAVAYSGATVDAQWLDSRQIAAAKAFTANGLSLNIGTGTGSLSTAQLYQFVQPVNANVFNPLYGLAGGNVLDATLAYQGDYQSFGSASDPMIGYRVGGTITFGGGLALYSGSSHVGGLGISGDTACADHSTAWRTRISLGLQQANPTDQLVFATKPAQPDGHPHCPNDSGTQGSVTPTTN